MKQRISNAKRNTIDGILFLQGVYKKDCKKIEDFFTDKLLNEDVKKYNTIPILFTGLDNHPKSTNILCWNCNRSFKGRPWFEPQSLSYNIKTKDVNVTCRGNFCGPNCVRAYINTYNKDMAERLNKVSMLKIVYEIFNGRKVDEILPAPDYRIMVQYGGHIQPFEYQKMITELDINYRKDIEANSFSKVNKEEFARFFM
jgi:hypothetical protein